MNKPVDHYIVFSKADLCLSQNENQFEHLIYSQSSQEDHKVMNIPNSQITKFHKLLFFVVVEIRVGS